ncbi:hypothetical protein DFS34DRAFT_342902 [Phlyctochytrium arcticum]|nr:hypothetical protein DFS34DRAFT_342902 [Phlyctochytrium arcticum]
MKTTAAIFLAIFAVSATTVTANPISARGSEDEFPSGDKVDGCQLWTNKYNSYKKMCCDDKGCSNWQDTYNFEWAESAREGQIHKYDKPDGNNCQRYSNDLDTRKKLCCPDRGCSGWQNTNDPTFPLTRRGSEDEFPSGDKVDGCQLWTNKYNSYKKMCCDDKGCSNWQDTYNFEWAESAREGQIHKYDKPDGNNCQRYSNDLDTRKKLCCPDRGCSGWQNTNDPTFPLTSRA